MRELAHRYEEEGHFEKACETCVSGHLLGAVEASYDWPGFWL